jgi:hypothetical protein
VERPGGVRPQCARNSSQLTTASFTAKYLSHANSSTMPESEIVWVRRSKPYDLRRPVERAEGLRACLAVFNLIKSGKARIGLLQKLTE